MNNKGFTLVELVATIALLAVISIISFVSINEVINQGKINDCKSLANSIKSASKQYVSDNRYNSFFVNSVKVKNNIKYVEINTKILLDNQYLSGDMVNPFNNSEILADDSIKIMIELKDNYTAKDIYLYRNSISDRNKFECSRDKWL